MSSTPAASETPPLLELEGINTYYGPIHILQDSNLVVRLDHGVKIAEGSFDAVATDPRVVEAYLGTKAASTK